VISIDFSEGQFDDTVDGCKSLIIQNLRGCRALPSGFLEASKGHLLLNKHPEDSTHLILADYTITVLIKQLERSCKTLLNSATTSHAAHDKVFSQIHGAVAVLVKNVEDHASELRMAGRSHGLDEGIAGDAAFLIRTLLECSHNSMVLRFRDLVCLEEFFLLLGGKLGLFGTHYANLICFRHSR